MTKIRVAVDANERGEVEALGIVSVTIELYLEMKYETASGKCVGTATIKIDIDVTLFSTTISITCSKKFAGSGPDPTLAEMFDVELSDNDIDTVGGLLAKALGKVPTAVL